MNKIRRKNLQEIIDQIDQIKKDLEALKCEEEEYRDNMPENLQGSERYMKAEEVCDSLDGAWSSLDDAIIYIEEAIE